MTGYVYSQVFDATLEYFDGDEFAAKVFVDKYALQNNEGVYLELTPKDMHRRIAKELARIESKYPNPLSEEEIFDLLDGFKYIVPQGSPMSAIGNKYQLQSLSNCFVIQGVYSSQLDSYGGIMLADQEFAQIMKRRGGCGADISGIRPKNAITNNAAKTTDGIGVFMDRFSNTCREVAQNGRRGAEMLTISGKHPEIETFINIKRDLKRVTGANNSIRLYDDFMYAIARDEEYILRWPVDLSVEDAKITKKVRARDIWNQIVDSAWNNAEPGLLFWDNVKRNTPSDIYEEEGYGSISTNPCFSENTLIAVADGRNAVTIKQLADENKDVPVYSMNKKTGMIEIKMGRHPRVTGYNKKLVRVHLDDGSFVDTTPDHKYLLLDGTQKEAKNLKSGDSLPGFTKALEPIKNDDNNRNYSWFISDQIKEKAIELTKLLGRRFSYQDWQTYAKDNNLPQTFSIFGQNNIKSIINLSRLCAVELGLDFVNEDPKVIKIYRDMLSQNYDARIEDGIVLVKRTCEVCNNEFEIDHLHRESSVCSTICKNIYINKNSDSKEIRKTIKFSPENFEEIFGSSNTYNKVVRIEELSGEHTVYNITVDDNHTVSVITKINEHQNNKWFSGISIPQCGEIVLSAYDACRLLVINLSSYVKNPFTKDAAFDYELFHKHAIIAQRLMDDIVDLEIEAIDRILAKVNSDPEPMEVKLVELNLWNKIRKAIIGGRRTGLGPTALGDTIAMMNIKYGSEESIKLTYDIYHALAVAAHTSSCIMAKERGAFPVFNYNKEKDHPYLNSIMKDVSRSTRAMWKKTGRRNIALTTTAPTGSVSTLTRTTSGIEPAYMLTYVRRKKINPSDKNARVDFVDALGDKWQEFTIYHPGIKKWMEVTGNDDITKSPYWGATATEIDWVASVAIQAAAQKSVDHSISKTCNLPANATKELVSEVYMKAWELGCKGFTVYREGCRAGVLVSENSAQKPKHIDGRPANIEPHTAPKRPLELPCHIKKSKIDGEAWTIFVGLLNGVPYEVFGGLSKFIDIPNKYKSGKIVKNGKNADGITAYNLVVGEGDDQMIVKDIANIFENKNYGAFTRTLSLAIRHGTPIQFVVEQLTKDKFSEMTSFSRVIARVLKAYIKDGTSSASEKKCPECGAENSIIYEEGCMKCSACKKFSKCG
jgi:ribonucleotide reductase alpha subunit